VGVEQHRKSSPRKVAVAVLTVSSTRTLENDESGWWIHREVAGKGHEVVDHRVVADSVGAIATTLRDILLKSRPQAVFVNGGTGLSPKDVTIEALRPLFDKEMTAFGVIFAGMSFDKVDTAALLSRATAGVVDGVFVACMPGSPAACKLAVREILLPELSHIVGHLG
jgi:molybdenum cofactor biosynthesis protein B